VGYAPPNHRIKLTAKETAGNLCEAIGPMGDEYMAAKSSVFENTYNEYIAQIARIDFKSLEKKLRVRTVGTGVIIPLFGIPYKVSKGGIVDPSGKKPSFDICVILCKYLLLCPDLYPTENDWVSFRDLKDAGPLTTYFSHDIERAIAQKFSGRLDDLKQASKALGGYPPDIEASYELAMQFDSLPRVPILMLCNDADDEFPAKCSVLFERRAERYLDPESLAMVGALLFTSLKKRGPI
jgi:hypothetical protein